MSEHKEVQFLETTIKALVSKPEEIDIKRTVDEQGVLLTVKVAKEDTGKVIGKEGNIARALRVLLRAIGFENRIRASLQIEAPRDNN